MTTRHDFGGAWDGLWTLSFGLSQFHGHGSWLMCEVALNYAFPANVSGGWGIGSSRVDNPIFVDLKNFACMILE